MGAYGAPSPERRLLLACARREGAADILMSVGSSLDWERFLADATHHGVTSLVYCALRAATDSVVVPPAVMRRVASAYYQQAAANVRLLAELRMILAACARAGIRVLVLKGAAMAEQVYGNIALCPMSDLDLLVDRQDLDAAERLLRELGYAPDESHRSAAWYRDHWHHLPPYGRPDGRTLVEVHWDILPPAVPVRIPIKDLWRRATPESAGGGAQALSPEDLLLHLCLHVALIHQFCPGLRPLCDIAEVVRRYEDEIDWTQVQERAVRWGVEKYIYLALRLARDLVDAAVPEEMLESLESEGFDPQVMALAGAQIFARDHQYLSMSPTLAQLCAPQGLRRKGILFLKSVFPSPHVVAERYAPGAGSTPIYLSYLVLWRDILRRNIRSAWGLLCRDRAVIALAERETQRTAFAKWLGVESVIPPIVSGGGSGVVR